MGLTLKSSTGQFRGLTLTSSTGQFKRVSIATPIYRYMPDIPQFARDKFSIAFDAAGAEALGDYDVNTLYFRDASFNRVAAGFSRTSEATRVNKQGLIENVVTGMPRIDYSKGSAKLLMEPSRTNLMVDKSFVVGSGKWDVAIRTSLAVDSEIGLDGTQTATRYSVTGDGNTGINYNAWDNPTGLAVGTYVFSFFVKDIVSTANNISVVIDRASGIDTFGQWNTSTNTVPTNCFLEQYGEWYRFSTVFTQTAGNEQTEIDIRMPSATTGDGMTIWGPQLEVGSYPTSYIPTAGSTVTRSAEASTLSSAVSTFNETYMYTSGNTIGTSEGMRVWFFRPNSSGWGLKGNTVYERIDSITFKSISASPPDYGKIIIRAVNNGEFSYWYNGNPKEIVTTNIGDLEAYAGSTMDINRDRYSAATIGIGNYEKILVFENTSLTDFECIQLTSI